MTFKKRNKSKSRGNLPRVSSQSKQLPSRASESLSLTELRMMAARNGIPWGGLDKEKLVKKINAYVANMRV